MEQVSSISVHELTTMAENRYGEFVKAVVDTRLRLLVVDAEMHVDEEQFLLQHDSLQSDLWGINLYPGEWGTEDFIEYDSMINLRPNQGNRSRGVDDEQQRRLVQEIVEEKIHD